MAENNSHSDETIIGDTSLNINSDDTKTNSEIQKIIATTILVFKRSKILLRKYLWLFLIILVIGIGYSVNKILNKEVQYSANLIFILQEESGDQTSASVVDPLSSYLLTRATSQNINLEKMKEISFSQRFLSNLLFNKCIISGTDDYLINHILRIYYGKTTSYFKSYRGLNGLNRSQFRVFKNVMGLVIRSININQSKAGAFNATITMKNEELTKVISELYYQNLSNFYIDKTTEKAQANYIFLRNRLDSIRNMLYSSEYQVANFEDRSRNLLLNTARVPQARQERNTLFYNALYQELLKTFENSKVALNNITPIFQLLQRPYYPLNTITQSTFSIVLFNMSITFVIMLLLFVILYIFKYVWPLYKHLFNVNEYTT